MNNMERIKNAKKMMERKTEEGEQMTNEEINEVSQVMGLCFAIVHATVDQLEGKK